jgi:hypothetical protein
MKGSHNMVTKRVSIAIRGESAKMKGGGRGKLLWQLVNT